MLVTVPPIILTMVLVSCQTIPDNSNNNKMDKDKIKSEIMQSENNLFTALRQGELMKAVSMHINSPDYRQIWNGQVMTYEVLKARVKTGIEKGLKSFDYQVLNRDFNFINTDNVLEILSVYETTIMADGSSSTSRQTAVSILWQRIDDTWRIGYVHGSELPKEN
ncbi:MAG TPA: nuclear transport factor 2 family protein [Chitinophagaceae bacterium]|nr:nuclear transport factor 2 family protein [Chitinophagaceae bacterium]